jgi:hypothetical protein
VSVLFKVKDTEQETLAVDRAMLAASVNSEFKNIVDIHKISAIKTLLEEHHENTAESKCAAINSTTNKFMSDIIIKNTQSSSSAELISSKVSSLACCIKRCN